MRTVDRTIITNKMVYNVPKEILFVIILILIVVVFLIVYFRKK